MEFKKGRKPWNKGLTKEDPRVARQCRKIGSNQTPHCAIKGKTFEEFYGKTRAETIRDKIRKSKLGTKASLKAKRKMSLAHLGGKNHFYGKTHTKETRKKIAESKLGKVGPNKGKKPSLVTRTKISKKLKRYFETHDGPLKGKHLSKKTREKLSANKKALYEKHPEKHPNVIMARKQYQGKGGISKEQLALFRMIQSNFSNAKLNFPVRTKKSMRFIDVALPTKKIGYEYDGAYWHNSIADAERDVELQQVGWSIIHILEGGNHVNG